METKDQLGDNQIQRTSLHKPVTLFHPFTSETSLRIWPLCFFCVYSVVADTCFKLDPCQHTLFKGESIQRRRWEKDPPEELLLLLEKAEVFRAFSTFLIHKAGLWKKWHHTRRWIHLDIYKMNKHLRKKEPCWQICCACSQVTTHWLDLCHKITVMTLTALNRKRM